MNLKMTETTHKFYKATNDNMFYSIFAKRENRDLLERLIEESTDRKMTVKRLLPTRQSKDNIRNKGKTLDIVAEVNNGEVNVELNSSNYKGLYNRNDGYIFKRYYNKLKMSENYQNMSDFIQINLTKGDKEMPGRSLYVLYDRENGTQFINNLEIYQVNLNKMKEICYNKGVNESLLSILDLEKEELEKVKGGKLVEKLKSEILRLNEDEEFVDFLTAEEDERKTMNSIKLDAFEQGAEQNNLEIAKKMLKENIELETISKITCLSIDVLNQLKEKP